MTGPAEGRFDDAALTDDGFLGGRLRVLQPRDGYRAGIDPVLLAAAVPARPGEAVLELGCGAGVALLCLGSRVGGLSLAGLERMPPYADLALRNATRNAVAIEVHCGDLAQVPVALRRAFDHVVANPPYLRAGGGTPAADAGRDAALREATPLAGWIVAARRRLRPGGTLTVIQAAERLPDLLGALSGAGFGTVVVLPVAPRRGRSAVRAIVTARKGGRGAFSLAAPFVLHAAPAHAGDREDLTPEAAAVLRGGAALVPDG